MAAGSLNTCTVQKSRAILNRVHILFHFTAILTLLYYRISNLLNGNVPFLPWTVITISELIFTFLWILTQAFRWRPVVRAVETENLPADDKLPAVDVFICTTDSSKEPVIEVMNTVLSAMALDYPVDKLAVYVSDDGGAPATLYAMKEACDFARSWIPFCRKYGIKTRCPAAYFSSSSEAEMVTWSDEFEGDEQKIKLNYEKFKKNVDVASEVEDSDKPNRLAHVEVIYDNQKNLGLEDDRSMMPLLVYVSRERRTSHPHHFKAGALNALLRVSGIMSNAPYALVLDCDMYCNDPTSAKQAMCFHLDPKLSDSLAYAQFPQVFYNISKNDIYDGQARSAYKTRYQGMDGIRGSVCAGTGYYLKKAALFGCPGHEDEFLNEAEKNFGRRSTKFIDSFTALNLNRKLVDKRENVSAQTIKEAKGLISCTFEDNTNWGKEIGYSYECMLESTFTGYLLHCKGWKSVYLYPKRPCFLGCATIDMKDAMVQLMNWSSALVEVGLSRFSPLAYGMSRVSILQNLCYGYFMFSHFFSIPCLLYGLVPQLCFLYGTPLYPKVRDPWFASFAVVFISSLCQHLYEVLWSGGSISTWWNEQRIWMIKSVTACLFGCLGVFFKWLGVVKVSFRSINKSIDHEKLEKYEKGKFNFKGAKNFMIPLILLVLLNFGCFIGGMRGLIHRRNVEEMFGQGFTSLYIFVLSLPILEGLIPKLSN